MSYISRDPFVFKLNDEVLFETDQVLVMYIQYEDGNCTVQAHGLPDNVEAHRARYESINAAVGGVLGVVKVIDASRASLEDLNHVINTSLIPESRLKELEVIQGQVVAIKPSKHTTGPSITP